jgi:predicted dehydrogenase
MTCSRSSNIDDAQIVAVCDLDTRRVQQGIELVDKTYGEKAGKPYSGTRGYADYHELLANKDIDAVIISTPDHQHAPSPRSMRCGRARMSICQKPASLTIAEGRQMATPWRRPTASCRSDRSSARRTRGRNSTAPASWSATAASAS